MPVDERPEGAPSALMWAARYGHTDAVRALLEGGAKTSLKNKSGWTALTDAAWHGHTEAVRALVEGGADAGYRSPDGMCPLRIAAQRGHAEAAAVLGAATDVDAGSGEALMAAAWNGHVEAVRALVAAGATLDVAAADGTTALKIAQTKKHEDVVQVLLDAGANPDKGQG